MQLSEPETRLLQDATHHRAERVIAVSPAPQCREDGSEQSGLFVSFRLDLSASSLASGFAQN